MSFQHTQAGSPARLVHVKLSLATFLLGQSFFPITIPNPPKKTVTHQFKKSRITWKQPRRLHLSTIRNFLFVLMKEQRPQTLSLRFKLSMSMWGETRPYINHLTNNYFMKTLINTPNYSHTNFLSIEKHHIIVHHHRYFTYLLEPRVLPFPSDPNHADIYW